MILPLELYDQTMLFWLAQKVQKLTELPDRELLYIMTMT